MTKGHISILGGGPAGLSCGYFAGKENQSFTIYESGKTTGGQCSTIRNGEFLFDTGAHRFHDKDVEATSMVKSLSGLGLHKIEIKSKIFINGRYINFPIEFENLVRTLPYNDSIASLLGIIGERLKNKRADNYRDFVIQNYGYKIADMFLLNYSEKLWGTDARFLSSEVSGGRLKKIPISALIKGLFYNDSASFEGSFYYPKNGYGSIADGIADYSRANIKLESRITGLHHDEKSIMEIEINERGSIDVDKVINTIPLTYFLQTLIPAPPDNILKAAKNIEFRNLIVVAIFLNKDQITDAASVYFPDKKFRFTRIHEPKNRSSMMAPRGKTSLVVEIPCNQEDDIWSEPSERTINHTLEDVFQLNWFNKSEIIGTALHKIPNAYPVHKTDTAMNLQVINTYLNQFGNLYSLGRNGLFHYSHLHDQIKAGKNIISEITNKQK